MKQKREKVGRPKAIIDWEKVDKMLMVGCTGTEVAANLGIHPETLYDACSKLYKTNFSDYSRKKKEKGFTMLKQKRFQIAMEGDNSMIMFLSKVMMGESEKQQIDHTTKGESLNDGFLGLMQKVTSKNE